MFNKLFLVCPFSCMEGFLRKQYGENSFFMTSMAGHFPSQDYDFMMALKDFILQEKIAKVYVVNDVQCRFINTILEGKKLFGSLSEKMLESLYIEYYFSDFKDQSLFYKQFQLASYNIQEQAQKMMESIVGDLLAQQKIEIKGIVSSREESFHQEIPIEKNQPSFYQSSGNKKHLLNAKI